MEKALVIIDIQNDITKNYKDIIDKINQAIDWAAAKGLPVIYIRHENLSRKTRTFKPGTAGAELASDLKIVSKSTTLMNSILLVPTLSPVSNQPVTICAKLIIRLMC